MFIFLSGGFALFSITAVVFFFFFSSRRRHTRCLSDWSSDVCSSDLATLAACGRGPAPRQYELNGQILGMRPAAREVTIRHHDIKGFMPGMTMPFKVRSEERRVGKECSERGATYRERENKSRKAKTEQ